jgi:hypothetical protein
MKDYLKQYSEFITEGSMHTPHIMGASSYDIDSEELQPILNALMPLGREFNRENLTAVRDRDKGWFIVLPMDYINVRTMIRLAQAVEKTGNGDAIIRIAPFRGAETYLCIETGIPVKR